MTALLIARVVTLGVAESLAALIEPLAVTAVALAAFLAGVAALRVAGRLWPAPERGRP